MSSPKNTTAALTYLVCFLPHWSQYKNDAFIRYHQKQAIGLLITALSLQGIISILGYWGVGSHLVLVTPVRLYLIVMVLIGMNNTLKSELKMLPGIGPYAARLLEP